MKPMPTKQDPAASTDTVFEVKGLKKEFDDGRVKALRGVDFRIGQGEFVVITGPSGCGKTTLLQLLGALDVPSAGSLYYRGRSLSHLPDPSAYRAREIGIIFQAFHLLPTFTAVENVQLPMFETGRPASQRSERAIELRIASLQLLADFLDGRQGRDALDILIQLRGRRRGRGSGRRRIGLCDGGGNRWQ